MLARVLCLELPPNVIVIASARFLSFSCANASWQNLNESLSWVTSFALGQVAFTESGVDVSSGARVPFISACPG